MDMLGYTGGGGGGRFGMRDRRSGDSGFGRSGDYGRPGFGRSGGYGDSSSGRFGGSGSRQSGGGFGGHSTNRPGNRSGGFGDFSGSGRSGGFGDFGGSGRSSGFGDSRSSRNSGGFGGGFTSRFGSFGDDKRLEVIVDCSSFVLFSCFVYVFLFIYGAIANNNTRMLEIAVKERKGDNSQREEDYRETLIQFD